jgi:hypothetical protein
MSVFAQTTENEPCKNVGKSEEKQKNVGFCVSNCAYPPPPKGGVGNQSPFRGLGQKRLNPHFHYLR